MARPRLVATDLDGTLLRSDGTVSPLTRAVLAAVEEAGVPVVFVTARPLRWMDSLWELVGAVGLAVISNGAAVYDVAAGALREVHGLEPGPGLEVADAIRAAVPGAQLAIETPTGIRLEAAYDEPEHVPPGSPVGPLEEIWDGPALKLLVRAPTADPATLAAVVAAAVGDRAVCTWSVPGLVEISAPGVTKATALARLCAELATDAADVVAFGDQPNDLPMLAWAGTSYAVADAHPDVRAAATRHALANDDDGVARALVELVGVTTDLL